MNDPITVNDAIETCAGCGTRATTEDDLLTGWAITDAAWCPKCRWLA